MRRPAYLLVATLALSVCFPQVLAAVLFEYKGPDLADSLQLTDLLIQGPTDPKVGDTISVDFRLRDSGQYPITFAEKGVFAAVRDPDGLDRSFGFTSAGQTITSTQSVAFSSSFKPDKAGQWRIWPSYQIWEVGGKTKKEGPAEWHGYVLTVGGLQIADLSPISISVIPETPMIGQDATASITVRNLGNGTSGTCQGNLISGSFSATLAIGSLKPSEQTTILAKWRPTVEGLQDLSFYADWKQEVQESNEGNNVLTSKVNVLSKPDLAVTDVTLKPETPTAGELVTIDVRVKNIGGSNPGVVSKGAFMVNGTLKATFLVPDLKPSEEAAVPMNWTPSVQGACSLSFMADYTSLVDESDEKNNLFVATVKVLPKGRADLYSTGISWSPELITSGRTALLKPILANVGEVESPECLGLFTANGSRIGFVNLPSLRPGGGLHENSQVFVSWTPSAPGLYVISFIADADAKVIETSETNNEAHVTVNVTPTDSTPPSVSIYYLPIHIGESRPSERDAVTFRATASDSSGISHIVIYVNGMAVTTCYNETSCDYTGGPYPRRSTVYYTAAASDKAGNSNITPLYNFTVRSYYPEILRLDMTIDPLEPTEMDETNFTATASYPYGIQLLRIYLNGHKVAEVSDATSLSIVRGPWASGSTVRYYAEAYSVDDEHATTPERSFTVEALGRENIKNMSSYRDREVFVVSDLDWRAVLSLVPIAVWREMHPTEPVAVGSTYKFPVLIYHQENETAFDADSVIQFLQQYASYGRNRAGMRVTILGTPPADLIRLMVAPAPVGAGLSESQIKVWRAAAPRAFDTVISLALTPLEVTGFSRALVGKWGASPSLLGSGGSGVMPMDDVFTDGEERQLRNQYWSKIDVYVVSEDEYATGLMASVYASLLNAPVLFQGHYDAHELDHKSVYLVGRFSELELSILEAVNAKVLQRFTLDELRRHYVIATATNGVILVNPLDLWAYRRTTYATDKASTVSYLFSKHSLVAPFLAAAKKEVIVSTTSHSYPEIDTFVREAMESLPLGGPLRYLTIVASPEAIPIARANLPYAPAMWGDSIYYQGARYIDTDIVGNTVLGDHEEYVTSNLRVQFNPACSEHILAWTDENTWGDIWYQDLSTGRIYQLTGANETAWYMIGSSRPAVYDTTIVWQDGRNGNSDIYAYDVPTNTTTQLTFSRDNQEWPAICGRTVVYQQPSGDHTDIMKYDLDAHAYRHVTWDDYNQERPSIWGNKIVYMDNRDGDWDVRMAVMDESGEITSRELIVTAEPGDQMYPRIYEGRIVWQDNSNGNWDIWLFDFATFRPERLTTEPADQVLPAVWGDNIAWYEKSDEGWWYVCVYNIPSRSVRRIARIEVSAESGPLWLEVDGRFYGSTQNLAHQDIATGRIYGVSASDVSAYVARDLFYDRINKNRDALVMVREDRQDEIGGGWADETVLENYARSHYWTPDVEDQFSNVWFYSGHLEVDGSQAAIRSHYDDCGLIIFVDHGLMQVFEGVIDSGYLCLNEVYLQPAVVLDLACLTGAYYVEVTLGEPPMVLSVQHIRRGAMAYMGATDVSYWHHMFDDILQLAYLEGKSIGEAYLEARNEDYDEDVPNFSTTLTGDIFYALLGDPTFCPRWW